MIVATAGHVDHGKTSLVRALTDIDTDRLEEEKRRGMSIDLGFAYADFGLTTPIGFVDVPGHERFVRNMLAGVAAIDCALLVIAADDGPMPQTLEHLAILQLLGLQRGVIALTKIDRVDAQRQAQAERDIRALLAHTSFHDAPILPVVATTGQGVGALRDYLTGIASHASEPSRSGNFRMSVDRAFSLAGAGLVVTGAVYSGRASVGERVLISPKGVEARIRSIHAQNLPSEHATAGQRCALNLSGQELRRVDVERGDWVVAPEIHSPTDRVDVELSLLETETRTLNDGTLVQLHLAAVSVAARVVLLGVKALAPGKSALAQLVLDKPIGALRADRFVLRDQAAQRTIGGGWVIDPFGASRGRAKASRLAELGAMRQATPQQALAELLLQRTAGVDLRIFERAWNLDQAGRQAVRSAVNMQLHESLGPDLAIDTSAWHSQRMSLMQAMASYHQTHNEHIGAAESDLISLALGVNGSVPNAATTKISRAALRSLLTEHAIVRDGLHLRLPAHSARLSQNDQILLDRVSITLRHSGLRAPIVGELSKELDVGQPLLLAFLQRASQSGHLAKIAENRFYLPETVEALVQVARELAALNGDQGFDAAAYRDKSGIGRNLTIQVLEFLDRNGFTRFVRERRWMTETGSRSGGLN